MTRRGIALTMLGLFNAPWIGLWWHFTSPHQERGPSVVALYMILIICTVGLVILPVFLGGVQGKRWLLRFLLGIINLFWCLRWIQVFAMTTPADEAYADARRAILLLMLISSGAVLVVYLLADSILRARHARAAR